MMLVLRSEIDILHGNNTPASEGKADFTNIKLGAKLSVPEGKPATGDKLGSSLTPSSLTEDEGLLLGSWVSLEGTELGIVLTGKGTPDTGEELTGALLLPTLLGTPLDMDGLEELPPTPTDTGEEVEGATDPLPGLGATLSVPEGKPATGDKLGSSLTPSSLTEDEGLLLGAWVSLEGTELGIVLTGKGTPDTGEALTGALLLPTLLGTALDMDGLEELPPTPTDTGKEVEGATDPLPGLGATLSVPEGPPATGDKLGPSLTPSLLTEDEGAALAVSSCWPSLGRGEGLKLSSALEGITLGCW